jgi:hypothetical protein
MLMNLLPWRELAEVSRAAPLTTIFVSTAAMIAIMAAVKWVERKARA